MGGQDGSRGYLIQAIIAMLESLGDDTWGHIQIEPDPRLHKVDILWKAGAATRVEQIRSSINQIGKVQAEAWAAELIAESAADCHRLVLVGPCAQSVVEMRQHLGVEVPCPKNLDIKGLLSEAAHELDKFLRKEHLDQRNSTQRELMVNALTTHLSGLSTNGQEMRREQLVELIKNWVGAFSSDVESAWELVTFDHQRGIESAVAGKRLGPADTEACPQFPVCDDIIAELGRAHFFEVVGTRGCGKSITAWHVARRLHASGFTVWRPRTTANSEVLLSSIPRSRALMVIDDAHLLGRPFAIRMSEISGTESKVLLVSTVQDASQASVICIPPERCVAQIATSLLSRKKELLPIIRQYDDWVGDGYGNVSLEDRVRQAQKENTPEEFFWILRGGWRTAQREYDGVKQFAHATDVLLFIAVGQIASCDAGVTYEWLLGHAQRAGIGQRQLESALAYLRKLGVATQEDTVRSKHLSYAYRILEVALRQGDRSRWRALETFIVDTILTDGWSLKGISWLLDAITRTDAFRNGLKQACQATFDPLVRRCTEEQEDIDWAAGCLSRLFGTFEVATDEILKHRELVLSWATSRTGLVSYFCGNIVNELINRGALGADKPARDFIASVDGTRLAEIANAVGLDDFSAFGSLLDRLGFHADCWAPDFLRHFDWARVEKLILAAPANAARSVDVFVTGLSLLTYPSDRRIGLQYVEKTVPYIVRAINSSPAMTVDAMQGIFWNCLGYRPKFLRRGSAPDYDQSRVAKMIATQLDPSAFARAIENATPRDLERIARAFAVLHEIEPTLIAAVAGCLSEHHFFAATQDAWVTQADELAHLLCYFCIGDEFQPAAGWVQKNRHLLAGPLHVTFVCIAPDIAMEFDKAGRSVELAGKRSRWQDRGFAIKRLMSVDKSRTIAMVERALDELIADFHNLTLETPRHLIQFCRTLFELSDELFKRFIEGINLDCPAAIETVEQLLRTQHRERRHYRQLAQCGRKLTGGVAELSTELLRRLEEAPETRLVAAPAACDARMKSD
jgi:hypothetical protein